MKFNFQELKVIILESSVNAAVVFLFIWATLGSTVELGNAVRPAILVAVLRMASHMSKKLDYVELGDVSQVQLENNSNTKKMVQSLGRVI